MDRILRQFRRIYSDNGSGDIDFSKQEEKLREAQARLTQATQDLIRSSERLNQAAMSAHSPSEQLH